MAAAISALTLLVQHLVGYIRIREESPIYTQLKSSGMHSVPAPDGRLHKVAEPETGVISLVRRNCGQGVVWYTGQFYALFYLQTILKVNARMANIIVAVALWRPCPSSPSRVALRPHWPQRSS